MASKPRIIGYGICGPGESSRYMRETLEEFKRLCDETIICVNPNDKDVMAELSMIEEFGFKIAYDMREWGNMQWKIKQDFIEQHVSKLVQPGDIMVCLDMDERFDRHITKEWLRAMPFDAYKVFIVDLWNDPEHYKPESCFWNTRIWRWTGDTAWIAKPVHCGLAPRWAVAYNRYAPFLLIHKGLMLREDRQKKIARYEKYDPHQQHLGKQYYWMLTTDAAEPFDEEALHATIATEVETYKQTKPRSQSMSQTPKERFAYVENAAGVVVDIPERHLALTLKQPNMKFVGWADEAEKEMDEMFGDDAPAEAGTPSGSYQRSTADEKTEVDALNGRDDVQLGKREARAEAENLPDLEQMHKLEGGLTARNRTDMKEAEKIRQAKKKAAKR